MANQNVLMFRSQCLHFLPICKIDQKVAYWFRGHKIWEEGRGVQYSSCSKAPPKSRTALSKGGGDRREELTLKGWHKSSNMQPSSFCCKKESKQVVWQDSNFWWHKVLSIAAEACMFFSTQKYLVFDEKNSVRKN